MLNIKKESKAFDCWFYKIKLFPFDDDYEDDSNDKFKGETGNLYYWAAGHL